MFRKILTSSLLTLIAVGGFFVSFEGNWITQTYQTYAADCVATPAAEWCPGFVGPPSPGPQQSKEVREMYNTIVAGLNIALSIVTIIVSPAIMLAGWLMSPDWTSGDLFGLRWVMYKLWVTISNITYFIYAILLIFIALATIFGKENYGYKAMLPKLALGILMVPFTWWFVQFTISLATIVTASVISIPDEALKEITSWSTTWWNSPVIPKKVTIDEGSNTDKSAIVKDAESCSKNPGNCISPQEMLGKSSGMYGHLLIYGYGVFKLNEVKQIDNTADAITSIVSLIHQSVIAIIMLVVFGLLTLALIFMLLARAVMLWVYTIFSPFMTLELVMWGVIQNLSKDFSIKEFIWLAFVPALVGLALSFWLVVIAAVQTPINITPGDQCNPEKLQWDGCKIASIMGNPENVIKRKLDGPDSNGKYITINEVTIGGVVFEFKGKPTGYTDLPGWIAGAANSVNTATSVISSAGWVFWTIVVDIIALLFIWMAFMAAKWVSKVVGAAAQPFEDMGKKIGTLWASLPKYMPLPIPGWSMAGAQKVASMPEQFMSQKAAEKTKWIEEKMGRAFGVNLPYGTSDKAIMKWKLNGSQWIDTSNHQEIHNQVKWIGARVGDVTTANGQEFVNDVHNILKNSSDDVLDKYNIKRSELESMGATRAAAQFMAWMSKKITSDNEAKQYFKDMKAWTATVANTSNNISVKVWDAKTGTYSISVWNTAVSIKNNTIEKSALDSIENGVKTKIWMKKPDFITNLTSKIISDSGWVIAEKDAKPIAEKVAGAIKDEYFDK